MNFVAQDVETDGIAVEGGAYTVERNRISGIRNRSGFALTGIRCFFDALAGNSLSCKHNYIADLQVPFGSGIDMAGISVVASEANAQITVDIEQDTIRNLSIGGLVTGDAYLYGIIGSANINATTYFCSGSINNCLIENLDNQVSGASTGCAAIGHLMGYKTGFTVSGNNIRNLRAKSNGLTGIVFSPETTGMLNESPQQLTITRHNISGLVNEHSGTVQVAGMEVAGRTPLVTLNRVSDLQTPNTTSEESFVAGLVGFDPLGTQTYRFQNNMVALDHNTHGSAKAAGIYAALSGATSINQINAEFNSVYIGGAGDSPTSVFLKEGLSKVSLKNNIFYNDCTGSGLHTAIANIATTPATNWLANASDHNYLVSSDPEALNLWGTEPQSISEWQTISSGDLNSNTRIAGVSTFPDLLFVDKTTANLDLLLENLDEVLVLQNAGVPVTEITEDFFGNPRDPNTPDLGAREFATVQVGSAGIPETEITVSPNPTTDFIDLRVSADAPAEYALQLTDAQGKVLLQFHTIETAGFQKRISLQQLPEGVYVLIVANKAGVATRQIIKR
ncbi:MAG: T9SS type A sorting domain-containing protein [Lewinellaceae bacterium]|nr:T9SS type A sorting domain-containing protein [Lewinellaceae bacterium]